jgi:hypothetical protein
VLYCNDDDGVESCTTLVEHYNGALEILRWTHRQAVVITRVGEFEITHHSANSTVCAPGASGKRTSPEWIT